MAALVVALGGYLYLVDSGRVTTGEADARKRNLFKAYRRAEISEIVVEARPGDSSGSQKDEPIRITRRPDDAGDSLYYVDGELADQPAVDKLLAVLEFATPERRLDGAESRHDMGLDAPRLRVTLAMGTLKYRLDIGGEAPLPPGAAYAEVQGEGLSVVARDLVTELSLPRDAYRGRTLIPYLSSTLAEISLDGAGGPRHFVKGPWGGWAALSNDQKVRVDRDAFDRVLASLADVRAESFVAQAEAEQVLAQAENKVRLTLVPTQGARAVLDIGGACPGHSDDVVTVRVEPPPKKAACVPRGALDPLSSPLDQLVDRHLFSLRTDETEQIALSSGDKKLELARLGTGWHLRAPTESTVDNDVGQGFARRLHDLVGEEIVPPSAPDKLGLATPRATATLTKTGGGDGEASIESIELGTKAADGACYARRLVDGAVLRLTPESAEALVPSSFSLRSLKVIEEPAAQVRRIAVDAGDVHQVLRRSASGEFTMEEPKGLTTDAGLASQLTEALSSLRAERWVADADDGSYGLAEPRAKYELEVGDHKIRVEVGRATAGGAFARRTDQPGVFVLPHASGRTIESWAVDRSYFMFDPKSVREVRLGDAVLAAERLETAKSILSSAHTEGVVHLGGPHKDEGFDKPLLKLWLQTGAPDSAPVTVKIAVGRGDVWRETSVFYIRREGFEATFAIAQSTVRPLLDLK